MSSGNKSESGVDGKDPRQLLDDIHSVGNNRASSSEIYNKWATNYEAGMREVNYIGPVKLVEFFPKFNIPKSGKILDAGAGTGAIGRDLVKLGYSDLHALDGAEAMLSIAKKDGNYKSYTHLLFKSDSKLPFETGLFDCVLLAGALGPGHMPIVALHELCRVTKVGGVVAWCMSNPKHYEDKDDQYANGGFYKLIDSIKNKGFWKERPGFPVEVPYIEYTNGYVMAFDVTGH